MRRIKIIKKNNNNNINALKPYMYEERGRSQSAMNNNVDYNQLVRGAVVVVVFVLPIFFWRTSRGQQVC